MSTDIEWTDETWNPGRGCGVVSPGCTNCYAMKQAHRFSGERKPYEGLTKLTASAGPQWNGEVRFVPEMLDRPLRWKKPRMVFVNSMSDLFHDGFSNEEIAAVFGVMAACPQHTFQVLTKRTRRMREWFEWVERREVDGRAFFPYDDEGWRIRQMLQVESRRRGAAVPSHHGGPWPLPNVWLGVSVEDQKRAEERIPQLLFTPAAIRFLSCEPLLGPIDFASVPLDPANRHVMRGIYNPLVGGGGQTPTPWRIDWVIVGGESGPGARPARPGWVQSLRDQCASADVPFFFKQWGAWVDAEQMPEDTWRRYDGACQFQNGVPVGLIRTGKKPAGRLLDGRMWDEMPREGGEGAREVRLVSEITAKRAKESES